MVLAHPHAVLHGRDESSHLLVRERTSTAGRLVPCPGPSGNPRRCGCRRGVRDWERPRPDRHRRARCRAGAVAVGADDLDWSEVLGGIQVACETLRQLAVFDAQAQAVASEALDGERRVLVDVDDHRGAAGLVDEVDGAYLARRAQGDRTSPWAGRRGHHGALALADRRFGSGQAGRGHGRGGFRRGGCRQRGLDQGGRGCGQDGLDHGSCGHALGFLHARRHGGGLGALDFGEQLLSGILEARSLAFEPGSFLVEARVLGSRLGKS